MSRLARSCKDWHQLLELCGLFQVLIGDADGVYDPTDANVHAADLSAAAAPAAFAAAAIERFGRIDIIVNNAGATKRGDFLALTEQDWSDGFALKFFAAVRLCRAAWPHLVSSRGSVVNIAGVGGRTGSAEFTIGKTVNAAVLNLTKCLADRGVRDGVRVNAINPGPIRTDRGPREKEVWRPSADAQRDDG